MQNVTLQQVFYFSLKLIVEKLVFNNTLLLGSKYVNGVGV